MKNLSDGEFLASCLILVNVIGFVIITFISWDVLWWWDVNDWSALERLFVIIIWFFINGAALGAAIDARKEEKEEE